MTALERIPFLLRLSVAVPPELPLSSRDDVDDDSTSLPPLARLTATRSQVTSTYADPTSDEQGDR